MRRALVLEPSTGGASGALRRSTPAAASLAGHWWRRAASSAVVSSTPAVARSSAAVASAAVPPASALIVPPLPAVRPLSTLVTNSSSSTPSHVTAVSTTVAGRKLALEVGRVGPLADGVVLASFGETVLLVSAVSKWDMVSSDMVPLQVDYRQKAFATGAIPSTFTRREGNSSDRDVLAARIIDRSLRPMFDKGYAYDTQILASVLSLDKDADPAMLSVVAASAALCVSDIPWHGPVSAARVGWLDGRPILAPTFEQDAASSLNLLLSGTDEKVIMMEAGAAQLPEAQMVQALRFAHASLAPLQALQRELASRIGKRKKEVPRAVSPPHVEALVRELIWEEARDMYRQHGRRKQERGNAQRLLFLKIKETLKDQVTPDLHRYLSQSGDKVMREALRSLVIDAAAGAPAVQVNALLGPAPGAPGFVADYSAAVPSPVAAEGAAADAGGVAAEPAAAPPVAVVEADPAVLDNDVKLGAVSSSYAPAPSTSSSSASSSSSEASDGEGAATSASATAPSASPATPDASSSPTGVPGCLYNVRDAAGARPDGRATTDIRRIRCELDVLPNTHGSAVFTRGDTQVLCTTTLGPLDQALVDKSAAASSGAAERKAFFLHYDFPPYCTNEVGKVGGSNRRMVGHGALAERALAAVMPTEAEFPYAVRVTSEVSGSDGSSSMATVCGATLALMDAGVPLKAPVAGISIGSICPPEASFTPGCTYHLLTDLFGLEDHSGDMDFKVAGSRAGVTAIQLDVKPRGLPLEVLEQGLWRARDARFRVLDLMAASLAAPRAGVKRSAPRLEQMVVPQELLNRLLGPGGANVRKIQESTGARIQVERGKGIGGNPLVSVYAPGPALEAAKGLILATLDDSRRMTGYPLPAAVYASAPVLTVGDTVTGRVSKVIEFGAVVEVNGHDMGWIHVGELGAARRVARAGELVEEGDEITAKVVDVDSMGQAKLSIRVLLGSSEGGEGYRAFIKKKAPAPAPAPPAPVEAAAVTTTTITTAAEEGIAATASGAAAEEAAAPAAAAAAPPSEATAPAAAPAPAAPAAEAAQPVEVEEEWNPARLPTFTLPLSSSSSFASLRLPEDRSRPFDPASLWYLVPGARAVTGTAAASLSPFGGAGLGLAPGAAVPPFFARLLLDTPGSAPAASAASATPASSPAAAAASPASRPERSKWEGGYKRSSSSSGGGQLPSPSSSSASAAPSSSSQPRHGGSQHHHSHHRKQQHHGQGQRGGQTQPSATSGGSFQRPQHQHHRSGPQQGKGSAAAAKPAAPSA